MKKITKTDVSIVTLIMAFFIFIACLIFIYGKTTEYRYDLQEVDTGVYAIYYNTNSRVPAHNYEVVTICCNNNIYTFKGAVHISYAETKPCALVRHREMNYADEVYLCVPKGSVDYKNEVRV